MGGCPCRALALNGTGEAAAMRTESLRGQRENASCGAKGLRGRHLCGRMVEQGLGSSTERRTRARVCVSVCVHVQLARDQSHSEVSSN